MTTNSKTTRFEPLKLYWTHPRVQWRGRGISEAWLEEMGQQGFVGTDDPGEADMAFFVSDSQLDPAVIGQIPTVCYFWGWLPERNFQPDFPAWATQQVSLMARCTRVLVPSPIIQYQLASYGVRSEVLLPGIDASLLLRSARRGAIDRKPQVVFLGRPAPHKGLAALIAALSLLRPPLHLLVLGPGGANQFAQLAQDMGVPTTFLEPTDEEKVTLLQESALLVQPSEFEGFGLPALEALFLGLPVIASDIPQHRWLLQENAFYFQSEEGLARTILDIVQNYDAAMERTEKGRSHVSQNLTLPIAAQRLWAVLHQVHKQFWATYLREDASDPQRVATAYEAEHRRNAAYGLGTADVTAPLRFDPTWARHWRAQHFIQALKEAGAVRIADVGAGAVYPTIFARAGFEETAVDVSSEALQQAEELARKWQVRIVTKQAFATSLPFPEGSFDACVLGEILEHVLDPEKVLAEALRIVKPGGVVVASTPIGGEHFDFFHIASPDGGWNDEMITNLLRPYQKGLRRLDKIAEDGRTPSCYLFVLSKEGDTSK